MPTIQLCNTDSEILSCFPVIHDLRPHLEETHFVERIRRQMDGGYLMAFLAEDAEVKAVAGFRFGEYLVWGRTMYVDDLVVAPLDRGKGYGGLMLEWLKAHARSKMCEQFHLDSGVQRRDAHRFYKTHGMEISSYHFGMRL